MSLADAYSNTSPESQTFEAGSLGISLGLPDPLLRDPTTWSQGDVLEWLEWLGMGGGFGGNNHSGNEASADPNRAPDGKTLLGLACRFSGGTDSDSAGGVDSLGGVSLSRKFLRQRIVNPASVSSN